MQISALFGTSLAIMKTFALLLALLGATAVQGKGGRESRNISHTPPQQALAAVEFNCIRCCTMSAGSEWLKL